MLKIKKSMKLSPEDLYMTGLAQLKINRSEVPAIINIDNSVKIQTFKSKNNQKHHKLPLEFEKNTGCLILANISFNIGGEQIVCSPIDSFKFFKTTNLDYLIIENCIVSKRV